MFHLSCLRVPWCKIDGYFLNNSIFPSQLRSQLQNMFKTLPLQINSPQNRAVKSLTAGIQIGNTLSKKQIKQGGYELIAQPFGQGDPQISSFQRSIRRAVINIHHVQRQTEG